MVWWANKPQFSGVRAAAANIGQSVGNYTAQMFQDAFPQFYTAGTETEPAACLVPEAVLSMFIDMANNAIQPDKWLDGWRYAVGLYVAHYATLSLRGYASSNETPEQAAASGALVGVVKSATLGDASVSYDTTALTAGTEDWGDLNSTTYGQILANRAKLIGMGGTMVL